MSMQRSLVEERFDAGWERADAAPVDWWANLERLLVQSRRSVRRPRLQRRSIPGSFLEIERKRSEVSGRPFLLLLIDLKRAAGSELESPIDATLEGPLFSALALCLRETDFVGWYRAHRSIGAVLTQDTSAGSGRDDRARYASRIKLALHAELPPSVSARLQLRVYQLPVEHHAPELTMITATTERRAQSPAATRTEPQSTPNAGPPDQPGALSRRAGARAQARRPF